MADGAADWEGTDVCFVLETDSAELADAFAAQFPKDDVARADQFVGITEVAAFAALTELGLRNALTLVSSFPARRKRLELEVDGNRLHLDYGPEDTLKILESDGLGRLIEALKKNSP